MKLILILITFLALHHVLNAQGVSVNTTGAPADASAMMDIQSTTKGVLIPRMTTAQRNAILLPATGLLVYDNTTGSFWYRTPASWIELVDNFHGLRDADHDTQVQVEESPDEDIIRFDIGGVEAMVLDETTQGATRLDIGPDLSLIIGRNAGLSSFPGWNTILGHSAGQFNTTGTHNVLVGYRAGEDNAAALRNVFVGTESGANNTGSFNTFTGYRTGYNNTTGLSNTFMGNEAGVENTVGFRNTFVGQFAGHNNKLGDENTLIGYAAGYNTEDGLNTFVGLDAGMANRSGDFNVGIGARVFGINLALRDLGNGNTAVGFEAGYSADSTGENTLMGYRAGYSLTTGSHNVYVGHEAGHNSTTGRSNVAIGIDALRQNLTGIRNVAVGDSALYFSTGGTNVALGSRAGMDNTTGSSNTFLGNLAGTDNTIGSSNTFVGNRAGQSNTDGQLNTFIGTDVGATNKNGSRNTMMGLTAGFRNENGNYNVFLGDASGFYNIDGHNNITVGRRAGTRFAHGNNNIAIGEHALGDQTSGTSTFNLNIAIGFQAAMNAIGNSNVVLGNGSGLGIDGINNVLLGNNIVTYGYGNTYVGTNTLANAFPAPNYATAIGYGTIIAQDNSVIIGNASNNLVTVGIGTNTPDAKLDLNSTSGNPLKVSHNGNSAFRILNNLDVVVDDELLVHTTGGNPMDVKSNGVNAFRILENRNVIVEDQLFVNNQVIVSNELLVNTETGKDGYHMSVNGNIVCEEVLVQNSIDWPDYVFTHDYALMNFQTLRDYIKEEKHLPGIPSASEVAAEGVKVGDMQKRLLEKIEEMTLYILQLESRLNVLENK